MGRTRGARAVIGRFLCKIGIHKRDRGVTGYVDRCKRCKTALYTDSYTPY